MLVRGKRKEERGKRKEERGERRWVSGVVYGLNDIFIVGERKGKRETGQELPLLATLNIQGIFTAISTHPSLSLIGLFLQAS